jgi:hypothetical protein
MRGQKCNRKVQGSNMLALIMGWLKLWPLDAKQFHEWKLMCIHCNS